MNTTQPPYATVHSTPERPRTRVPKLPPLQHKEDLPTINVSDADGVYSLSGYGEIPVSEYYDVPGTNENKQNLLVPRLRHIRPRARYQTTKAVSDPTGGSGSDDPDESLYTPGIQQLACFRDAIEANSKRLRATPSKDTKEFFENFLKKPPPTRRRKRTLILPTSPASEAVDACPCPNSSS